MAKAKVTGVNPKNMSELGVKAPSLLSPSAVAKMKRVHVQTVLNALRHGTLKATCLILGSKKKVSTIGVSREAADAWMPRCQGRPRSPLNLTAEPA